jgi:hypothetical protein
MKFFISFPAWSALWWDAGFILQSKEKKITPNNGLRVSCRPTVSYLQVNNVAAGGASLPDGMLAIHRKGLETLWAKAQLFG